MIDLDNYHTKQLWNSESERLDKELPKADAYKISDVAKFFYCSANHVYNLVEQYGTPTINHGWKKIKRGDLIALSVQRLEN